MEYTHGKITFGKSDKAVIIIGQERRDYIASVQIRQTGGGAIAGAMESKRLANAHHLIKCWNSFEKDGLVDKLLEIANMVEDMPPKNDSLFDVHCANLRAKAKRVIAIAAAQIEPDEKQG